jgi:hypothetical protein
MTSPKFGDRVSCLQKLRRSYDFSEVRELGGPYKRVWRRVALEPRRGILIGYRTLQDVRVFPKDGRFRFVVVRRLRAALVVFSGAENPVYVPVDAMVKA